MQISLDYFRILGVPLQADSDLINQAYEDRLLQLPHEGYSEYGITSRQNLLKVAYDVLKDEESRLEYESSLFTKESQEDIFLETSEEVTVEITNDLLVGALIILYDLGDFELVLRLATPYFEDKNNLEDLTDNKEEIDFIWQDLILTAVLAYLELAREKWQDKEYELAANYLQKSYNLLNQEDLFQPLKKEIQQDLGKLKPYEILELLTRENEIKEDREKALNLLQEILNVRGGIESQKIDDSGLNVDSFLRFIQQIRVYLTAEEQQILFENEAKRPSPAAAYLTAYACLARGFTERKPDLIIKAKNNLISLTIHQDVYLEQSICALLLGQTTEAEFSLSQSKEKDAIARIQEISANSPDLLPGLCVYTEKWLQTEVFPQFKGLRNVDSSLQAYFADEKVQNYLESISPPLISETEVLNESSPSVEVNNISQINYSASNLPISEEEKIIDDNRQENQSHITNTQVVEAEEEKQTTSLLVEDELSPSEDLIGFGDFLDAEIETDSEEETPSVAKSTPRNLSPWYKSPVFVPLIGLIISTAIAFLAVKILFKPKSEPLNIPLSEPLIQLTSPEKELIKENLQNQLTPEKASEIIAGWLNAKQEATGPNYNFIPLNQVLSQPLASVWIANGNALRRINAYRRYEHDIKIQSAEVNPQNTTEAIIKAEVWEKSQYYQNGALKPRFSYEERLLVEYSLVKEADKWLIQEIKVL